MALSLFTADPVFNQMERMIDRSFDRAFGNLLPSSGGTLGQVLNTAMAHVPFDIIEKSDRYQLVTGEACAAIVPATSREDAARKLLECMNQHACTSHLQRCMQAAYTLSSLDSCTSIHQELSN